MITWGVLATSTRACSILADMTHLTYAVDLKKYPKESDVGQLAEVLVVLGEPAFTLADRPDSSDELDRLDPFDHLEAELILDTQSQWRSVQMIERLVVHLVRQQCLRVQCVLDREVVVISNALDALVERDALAEGVEDDRFCIGSRPDQSNQLRQRQPAPRV